MGGLTLFCPWTAAVLACGATFLTTYTGSTLTGCCFTGTGVTSFLISWLLYGSEFCRSISIFLSRSFCSFSWSESTSSSCMSSMITDLFMGILLTATPTGFILDFLLLGGATFTALLFSSSSRFCRNSDDSKAWHAGRFS